MSIDTEFSPAAHAATTVGSTTAGANFARPAADAARHLVRVLHIINGEHYAGAERAQDLMALRLPEFGYEVTFVCLKHGKFAEARRSQAAPLVTLPMRGRFDLRPARAVARMVRDEDFALIHTHTPRSSLVGGVASAWARVPLVHHIQSPASHDSTSRWRNWVNAAVERASAGRAAAILPVSKSLEDHSRTYGPRGRSMAIVPNGVPARPSLAARETPSEIWTIGTVALFRPRKGLDVLLSAFAGLHAAGLPVRLRAVGRFETPEYETQIMNQVRELGIADAIEWRGFRHDVQAELDTMDLFVLPSLFGEGLPFVVLEAMSAGVPVISTNVEGIPEAVRDGRDGLIVEPSDVPGLAGAMGRFVTGQVDWQALRRSAYERQSSLYTDVSMSAGVAAAYDAVLDGRRANGSAARGVSPSPLNTAS
ncbi:MAG: glycosyltransferase [Pirellulales bacterium]